MNDSVLESNGSSSFTDEFSGLFTQSEAILLFLLTAIMAVFGVLANTVTLLVIRDSVSLRGSAFNILIASLCVSDIVSASNSIFAMYWRTYGFIKFSLPNVICKITTSLRLSTDTCTSHHIFTFCVLRLMALYYPQTMRMFTPSKGKMTAILLWIETLLSTFVIYMVTSGISLDPDPVPGAPNCGIGYGKWRAVIRTYRRYTSTVLQHIPTIGIIVCSCVIGYRLLHMKRVGGMATNTEREKKERSALIQTSVIVVSFLFGYSMPIVYRYIDAFDAGRHLFTKRTRWQYWTIAYLLTRVSECINPICYNYASSQMWKATKKYLHKLEARLKNDTGGRSNQPSVGYSKTETTRATVSVDISQQNQNVSTVIT